MQIWDGADDDRAEFCEREPAIGQSLPLPTASLALGPHTRNVPAKDRNLEPNWKPISINPAVDEPSNELLAPKDPVSTADSVASTPDATAPASALPPQDTVQPQEIFRPLIGSSHISSPLGGTLDPTVSTKCVSKNVHPRNPQPAGHVSKVNAQGKATRLNDDSASAATITAAIIAALAEAEVQGNRGCSLEHDSERDSLPNGQSSSGGTWKSGRHQQKLFDEKPKDDINISSPSFKEESKSLQERKAREVLKTLHELGYIVQKDPSHSPKPQNPGSAASNKSDHLVTCQTCKRFTGRPCELTYVFLCLCVQILMISRKHMKRHSRPYGCTFLNCSKTFGSKNDWKRHENSQHYHHETWRCDAEKVEGGTCAKMCYRRQSFQDHLKKDHDISDPDDLKTKVDACRIGRNCQSRFWCGFCVKLVDLTKKGLGAWIERFDHIDDHFMGRHGLTKQSIQDWIPVDSDKPKGDVETPVGLSPEEESQGSPSDSSPYESSFGESVEASGIGESAARPAMMEKSREQRKRSRSSSDDDSKPAKHHKPALRTDTIVYCV
jgi:hypothetical protein